MPFAAYNCTDKDEVRIYALLDCRRDPAWINDFNEQIDVSSPLID